MLPNKIKSIFDIMNVFDSEEKCIEYLEKLRWNGNVSSPFCEGAEVSEKNDRGQYLCKTTNKYFNVKNGTLFHNTKVDLRKWFVAIYLVSSHKKGLSSVQLGKQIDVTQKTAWHMLQRIRNCFGDTSEEQLEGIVEADETFVGGKNKNRHKDKKVVGNQGRAYKDKTPVFGMVQRGTEDTPKRIKVFVAKSTTKKEIQPFILDHVKKDATFYSDEWHAYRGLHKRYNHQFIDHSKGQYVDGDIHTNSIEGAWGIFKRMIIGTYHRTSKKHLQLYCNEFQFRYNHMTLSVGDAFDSFFNNMGNQLTYKELTA